MTTPKPDPADQADAMIAQGNRRLLLIILGTCGLLWIALIAIGVIGLSRWLAAQEGAGGRRTTQAVERPAPAPEPSGAHPPLPIGSQADWFPIDAYPPEARRRGEEGAVSIKLAVGEDGRAAGCIITASSGSPRLDEATCRLATRNARFHPARDPDGTAMAGYFQMRRIVWRLDQ